MRYNVTVTVPYAKRLPYTLFAKGSLSDIPHVDDGADFVHFKFGGGTVFVLFYTFTGFRRAYIVTGWQNEKDGEAIILPGVNEKLCLIFIAQGRKIDDLKRVLYILTDEQNDEHKVFSLPLIFWYRLSALIQQSEAHRSDIALLWEKFTKKKLLQLTKKERNAIRAKRIK
ncbi:MAG: hypothetical protein IJR39_07115 [Treponema sp.]|nr:hypothetical protein [Treponema sp.]MBQ9623088.1 hypothetical protein [Treponema sp.]